MNKIQKAKNRYWKIVIQSAIELFGMSEFDAREEAEAIRRHLDNTSKTQLYYHEEAIYTAASLSGLERDSSNEKNRKAYDAKIERLWTKYYAIMERIK